MPKVIKSTKRFTKKCNNRVKSGKKHTRKNHLKRIYKHHYGGSSTKKLEEALSKLPSELRESIRINKRDLSPDEIKEIYKEEDGNVAKQFQKLEIFLNKEALIKDKRFNEGAIDRILNGKGNSNKVKEIVRVLSNMQDKKRKKKKKLTEEEKKKDENTFYPEESKVGDLLRKMKFNKYRLNSKTGNPDTNLKKQAIDIVKNNKDIEDFENILTSKLTKQNINDIIKDSKLIACKEEEIRKELQKMKFNPSLIDTNTGKLYKSLLQQAKQIVDKEGKTEQDIIDLIKNNSSEHIYSSTDVDKKLR